MAVWAHRQNFSCGLISALLSHVLRALLKNQDRILNEIWPHVMCFPPPTPKPPPQPSSTGIPILPELGGQVALALSPQEVTLLVGYSGRNSLVGITHMYENKG